MHQKRDQHRPTSLTLAARRRGSAGSASAYGESRELADLLGTFEGVDHSYAACSRSRDRPLAARSSPEVTP